jgi:large subunit ribosomal protein L25
MTQAAKTQLNVALRNVLGKKVRALRRQGQTPANIYGHRLDSVAVQVQTDELLHTLKAAGRNDLVYLQVDGEERPTFVKQIQRNPVTDVILHVDFLQISLKEKVRLDVAIHLTGVAPAVETYAGILVHGLTSVTVEALPTEVPSFIELDVSGLVSFDETLHVSDLRAPAGVEILTDADVVVAKVAPPAVEVVEEVAEPEEGEVVEGEEGAAPAEGEEPSEESKE